MYLEWDVKALESYLWPTQQEIYHSCLLISRYRKGKETSGTSVPQWEKLVTEEQKDSKQRRKFKMKLSYEANLE